MQNSKTFRAGAQTIDITPETFPVIVNGGFLEKEATNVHDRLHARCLVLVDVKTRLAIVVVDTYMMPRGLIDEAKALAKKATGIPTDRLLISATHAHSAPAAMGDRIPASKTEVYCREQLLIKETPQRQLKLPALRLGDLGITAIPKEVFAITGLKIKALKNVTGNEIQFLGHFPEHANMPGVFIVEAIGQSASILFSSTTKKGSDKGEAMVLGSINNMRYFFPVYPGQTMFIEVKVIKMVEEAALVEGIVMVEGNVVVKGKLGFARRVL